MEIALVIGDVSLENIRLRESALAKLDLPVSINSGMICNVK